MSVSNGVLRAVSAEYRTELVAEGEPWGGRAVLRLRVRDTNSGRMLVLRQRPSYLSHREYALALAAQQRASAHALAPLVESTRRGDLLARALGESWALSRWVDGVTAITDDLPLVCASLAEVQDALKPTAAMMSWDHPRHRWFACADTGPELARLASCIGLASGLARRIRDMARRVDSMPLPTLSGVIHGDAALDNVVLARGRPVWVDFDNSRLSLLASDLTQLLARSVVVPAVEELQAVDFSYVVDLAHGMVTADFGALGAALGISDVEQIMGLLAVALVVAVISETDLDDPDLVSPLHAPALLHATLDSIESSLRG